MNIRIDIIIPPSTDFATLSRATRFVDEFTSELREFAAVAVGWGNGAQPQPAPDGHATAPQPEPQPQPEDVKAEFLAEVVAELQRLAKDGIAPSQTRWNDGRRAGMLSAVAVTHRLRMSWEDICAAAQLRSKRSTILANMADARSARYAHRAAPAPADEQEDAGGDDAGF